MDLVARVQDWETSSLHHNCEMSLAIISDLPDRDELVTHGR